MSRDRRPHYQLRHGRISGFMVVTTLAQTRPPRTGVHLRWVPRFASGFCPTRPHGQDEYDRCVKLIHLVQLPPACGCLRQAPQGTCTPNRSPMPSAATLRPPPVDYALFWADLLRPLRREPNLHLLPVLTNLHHIEFSNRAYSLTFTKPTKPITDRIAPPVPSAILK